MMFRKFIYGAGVFACSVVIFSFIRQIIVFPEIAKADEPFFGNLVFAIFSFEAIAYGFTGAFPDYYVRQVKGGRINIALIKALSRLCRFAPFSAIAFYILGMSAVTCGILSIYLYFFSINALKLKLVFNDLRFSENIAYMSARSAPYLILLAFVHLSDPPFSAWALEIATALILIFEIIYGFRLRAVTKKYYKADSPSSDDEVKLWDVAVILLPFCISYFLLGIMQRGDLTFVKLIDEVYYVEYAKIILTVNFFCAPLTLMISNPLLSFVTKHDISLHSTELKKILWVVAAAVVAIGGVSAIAFNEVYKILYDGIYLGSRWIIFYYAAGTLLFAILRTLVIKYSEITVALFSNACVVVLTAISALYFSVQYAIMLFFFFRVAASLTALAISKKETQSA